MDRLRSTGISFLLLHVVVFLILTCNSIYFVHGIRSIAAPKLNVPVWSLATLNSDDSQSNTNMNILMYASAVSIQPTQHWAVSLYKHTLSHRNFKSRKWAVLQRLTTDHIDAIDLLGKQSGNDVDKVSQLRSLGFRLQEVKPAELLELQQRSANSAYIEVTEPTTGGCGFTDNDSIVLFEDSPCVILLESIVLDAGIDVGDHDVFLCKSRGCFSMDNDSTSHTAQPLSSDELRRLGII